jgi:ATP-binding cassette subfamily F protein uup
MILGEAASVPLGGFCSPAAGLRPAAGSSLSPAFMALFSLLDVTHAFGGPPLLDSVNFQVEAGERVCLVGRNLLVLDEPTNDLDAETLDLLEDLLVEFKGTLLLVSHDREFLDNVVTSTLVFEGEGRIGEYVGGYTDWLRQRPPVPAIQNAPAPKPAPRPARPRKLTGREERELAALPAQIETLETEQGGLVARLADPGFYQREPGAVAEVRRRLVAVERDLTAAFARWEELEDIRCASA